MVAKRWFHSLLKGLAVTSAATAVLVLNIYFAPSWWGLKAYLVPTESMTPTLIPGDVVLVNLRAYATKSPQAGDIVVFADQAIDAGRTLLKRIVSIEGGCLEKAQCPPEQLPDVYVQGDNASHSYDSRNFGAIASSQLIGKAFFILVTLNANGTLHFERSGWL